MNQKVKEQVICSSWETDLVMDWRGKKRKKYRNDQRHVPPRCYATWQASFKQVWLLVRLDLFLGRLPHRFFNLFWYDHTGFFFVSWPLLARDCLPCNGCASPQLFRTKQLLAVKCNLYRHLSTFASSWHCTDTYDCMGLRSVHMHVGFQGDSGIYIHQLTSSSAYTYYGARGSIGQSQMAP